MYMYVYVCMGVLQCNVMLCLCVSTFVYSLGKFNKIAHSKTIRIMSP